MSFSIASTLEKFTNRDKDFRCMACADLTVELGKETFKMDSNQEKQITNGIIKLLEDDHSQVQELAVKTLGPLSLKVPEAQVNDMIDNCARLLLTTKKGQEDLREIGNNGLKVIITAIPTTNKTISASLANRATLKLVDNISKNESNLDIVYVSLDALNELLSKFAALAPDHEKLLKVIEPQLGSQRQITRKCAISCLGHLATSISDKLFASLVANLVKHVEGSKKTEEARTYIQAIGAISRSAGGRLGRFLEQIIPLISKYADGKDDDLREECFSCFELLVLKCPGQITPYIPQTTDLALKYVKQENLVEEDDDEMDVEEGDDMEEDGDDEEEEGDGDEDEEEDDSTWKVRRASTKCLDAIISTHPELLPEIGDKIVVALVARFKKEREENVKLEIFSTFSSAVRHLSSLAAKNPEGPSANTLKGLGPKVVAALSRQLKDKSKSVKVRTGAFSVLKEVAAAIPGSLKDQVAAIVPGLQLALGDKATNHELRVQALSFLLQLFSSHEPSVIQPHVKTIAPLLNKAIKDSFGKTSAAGLRAGTVFVRVLRPEGSTFDFKPYVKDFFAASVHKLNDKETEQDVKESSITCTALIVANLGDELKTELKSVLTTLVERLSNEITAVAATKAFDTIASSKLKLDLSPVLPNLIKELLALVQKTNARQAALATLGSVIKVYGSDKAVSSHYKDLLTSVGPFVSEQDLQLAHYVLRLATIILEVQPDTSAVVGTSIVTPLFVLLRSSVLQGVAVQSASGLLRELVKVDAKNLGFDSLLKELLKISQDKGASKTVLANVAKGVASVIASAKADKQETTIGQFVKDLGSKDLSVRYFALYSLGEVGTIDKSHGAKVLPLLYEHSSSDDEGTRQVVSESLGKLALAHPADVVASFQEHIKSKSAHTRSTVLGGLKYSLVEKPQEVDKVLQPVIGSLLDSIKDSDLNVRRNAVLALDAAVRYKASLVKSVVATHLGAILSETTKKPELVRTIDLGMMKHEVDEGLENRKSAFYLINNLLDASFELGDLSEFVNNQLTAALKDTNDLKLLAYSTVSKLAGVPSGAESLRKGLEKLVEAFTTTVAKPVDPKKPEDALPDEIVRSGLVAVASLALIPGPAHPKLDELLQAVNKGDLKDKFAAASVQEETKRDLRSSKQ